MASRAHTTTLALPRAREKTHTVWPLVLMGLGGLAMVRPIGDGLGANLFLGWVIVFGGCAHIASCLHPRMEGARFWRAWIGLVYVLGGLYVALQPSLLLLPLTLATSSILTAEAALLALSFFRLRTARRGWLLWNALVAFALGFLVWFLWPATSAWAIGTLVGTNLLMSGFVLLVYLGGRSRTETSEARTRGVPWPARRSLPSEAE